MFRNWSQGFSEGNAVYQLNMLANASNKSVEQSFVDLVGLDIRTVRVLRLIGDRPGITFAEITALGAIERSLASRMIQNLVRLGYAERQNDENDARRFGLFITPSGQAVRRRADMLSGALLEVLFTKFRPDEVGAFKAHMARLAEWMDSDEYEARMTALMDEVAAKIADADEDPQDRLTAHHAGSSGG